MDNKILEFGCDNPPAELGPKTFADGNHGDDRSS